MTRADGRNHELSNEPNEKSTTVQTDDPEPRESDSSTAHDYEQNRENESVTPETRSEVLKRDGHRCQICGREGPERGGLATLHVHHIERDPADIDENAPENLTTLCRSCHSWVHQQSTPADAPVTLSEADLSVLLPQDIEILRFLAESGPARTGRIADALTANLSMTAVRERLAVLMGLDNMVESRDRQIIDQDVESGEWGLTEHIEHSARGHIPDDPQALLQRMEDEQVRQALERGCDRQEIMNVLDISRRTTFHREKRAYAYDFPLDVFRRSGRGGQHPAGNSTSETIDEADTDSSGADEQQRLDSVPHGAEDGSQTAGSRESVQDRPDDSIDESVVSENKTVVREQLQTAITALQQINAEL
ncbi:HNH endonuclease [Natrialbaceae archaeon AArc-T1-2]|uniref:HNH endonuclease n=1 Tax=Natrialbaceae archaeon AArc-T1-2 TaxID=3053904 RepID=UPI00255B0795|nr:HNH endonuclease [Natrialbaceae archaeon AArc-T1-2]WIV67366.1 HNH endonuclease [Natrialbaceae archaeon AArc-T1-2]